MTCATAKSLALLALAGSVLTQFFAFFPFIAIVDDSEKLTEKSATSESRKEESPDCAAPEPIKPKPELMTPEPAVPETRPLVFELVSNEHGPSVIEM